MENEIIDRNNAIRDWFNDSEPWMNNSPTLFDSNFPDDSTLKTDIKETDKNYIVKVDMPAFDKKNITLNYQDNILTVSGHRDSFNDHNDKNGDMIMSERSTGRFTRQYHLPQVDQEAIKATYDKGVLNINLPKLAEKVDSGHKISID